MDTFDQYRIVLVEPENPINVGNVIRAMKNFGFRHLYLVNPAEMDLQKTQISAHRSADMLDHIVIVPTLAEALADVHESYGFSARHRSQVWASLELSEAVTRAKAITSSSQNIAYVFGRERTGLTNDELNACSCRVHIETTDYSSLNLAQAVILALFESSRQMRNPQDESHAIPVLDNHRSNTVPATHAEIDRLMQRIESMLVEICYFKSAKPSSVIHRLRNIVLRSDLDDGEVNLLIGICAEVENYARLIERGIKPGKLHPPNL